MTRKVVILTGAAVAAVGLVALGYVKRAVLREKAQKATDYLKGKIDEFKESLSLEPDFSEEEAREV